MRTILSGLLTCLTVAAAALGLLMSAGAPAFANDPDGGGAEHVHEADIRVMAPGGHLERADGAGNVAEYLLRDALDR